VFRDILHWYPFSLFSPNGHFLVANEGFRVLIWSLRDGSSKTLLVIMPSVHSRLHSVQTDDISRLWIIMAGSGYGMHGQANFWTNGKATCVWALCGVQSRWERVGEWRWEGILRYWDVSSLADMEMGRDRGIPDRGFNKFENSKGIVCVISEQCTTFWGFILSISTGINSFRFLFT
jgi:hypothetical protein